MMKCRLGIYRFGFLSIFLVVLAFCNHEITCVPESVGVIHITVRVVGMRPFPPLGRHMGPKLIGNTPSLAHRRYSAATWLHLGADFRRNTWGVRRVDKIRGHVDYGNILLDFGNAGGGVGYPSTRK